MVMFKVTICSRQARLCLTILLYQHPSHPTSIMIRFKVQRVTICSMLSICSRHTTYQTTSSSMVMFRVTIYSRWIKLCLTILLYQHTSHVTNTVVMFRVTLGSRHPSHLARSMVKQKVTFYSRWAVVSGLQMLCNTQELFSPVFLPFSPTPTIFPNTFQLFFGVWAFEHKFSLKINVQSEQLYFC